MKPTILYDIVWFPTHIYDGRFHHSHNIPILVFDSDVLTERYDIAGDYCVQLSQLL